MYVINIYFWHVLFNVNKSSWLYNVEYNKKYLYLLSYNIIILFALLLINFNQEYN